MTNDSTVYKREIRLFYSWQSDIKSARDILFKALGEAQTAFASFGIRLIVEQDTGDRSGAPDIAHTIFEKIDNCHVFLADVSPITETEGIESKLLPNPNVMFESGYALKALGADRILFVAHFKEGQTQSRLPFDIRSRRITAFRDEEDLKRLPQWIMATVKQEDERRKQQLELRSCSITFADGKEAITMRPKFRHVYYCLTEQPKQNHNGISQDIFPGLTAVNAVLKSIPAYNHIPSASVVNILKGRDRDLSFQPIVFEVHNTGSEAIENCDIHISASQPDVIFAETDVVKEYGLAFPSIHLRSNKLVREDGVAVHYGLVNPGATHDIGGFFLRIPPGVERFTIHWVMHSRYFMAEGDLTVSVNPETEYDTQANDRKAGTDELLPFIQHEEDGD